MSRRWMMVGSIIVGLVLAVVIYQTRSPSEADETAAEETSTEETSTSVGGSGSIQAPSAGALLVHAEPAHRGPLVERITANGVAESQRFLDVSAEVAGKISHVAVVPGDWVEAGDLLLEVDDIELVMARDRAQENLEYQLMTFATNQIDVPGTTVNRNDNQGDENALDFLRGYINEAAFEVLVRQPDLSARIADLTRADLFAARAQLTDRRVQLEQAELDLSRARVYAPFGGQVAALEANSGPDSTSWPVVGQQVGQGTNLMVLVDADPIRVRVEVIESEISFVREGRRADVTFAAYPGETFTGSIEAVSPLVDADRKTLSVTVRLPNADHRLKPGMFAQVVLDADTFQDRLLVPAEAVLVRDNRRLLFVVRDGFSQWVYVDTGLENADWIEVLSEEVREGDLIITSGHFTLGHDVAVTVIEPEPEGGS